MFRFKETAEVKKSKLSEMSSKLMNDMTTEERKRILSEIDNPIVQVIKGHNSAC